MSRITKALMGRWLRPGGPLARRRRPRKPRLGLEAMEGRTLLSGAAATLREQPPVEVAAQASARIAMTISEVDGFAVQNRTATFTARLTATDTGAPVSSRLITFRIGNTTVGTARTDGDGLATLSNVRISVAPGVYPRRLVASFAGTARLDPASARGPLTVSRAASSMASVAASGPFGGTGTFVARVISGNAPVVGRNVQFLVGSRVLATATTDPQGFAVVAGVNLAGWNVGGYTVRARFSGDAGFARSSSTGDLTVNRAMVNVTLGGLSATYNGAGHAASATTSQPGLSVAISYADAAGNSVVAPVKAGQYRVTASVNDPNYSGQATGVMTIGQASLTASGLNANKVYNGTTAATINAAGAVLNGVVPGDSVAISTAGVVANFLTRNVGNNLPVVFSGLGLTGSDSANYTLINPTITGDITPAGLLASGITANNRVYDGTTHATIDTFGASLSGAVPGDDVTLNVEDAVGVFDSKNAGPSKMVHVNGLALAGTDAGNYFLSPTILSATIAPATLNVSGVTAENKVYDANTNAVVDASGATLSGMLAGDSVGLDGSMATGSFASKNVGVDIVVTVNGLLLTGPDAMNYVVGTTLTSANVTPAPLSVSGLNANKVYDGTTNATINAAGAVFGGLFTGDVVTLDTSGVTGSFATRNVGNDLPVTYSGLALAGADAGNYVLTGEPDVFGSITPATLTVSGVTVADRAYDGTTDATLNVATPGLQGVFAGDSVNLDDAGISAVFIDKNAGVNKTVLLSGVSISGPDVGNYVLDTTLRATITPRVLTVDGVTAEGRVYDGTTAATVDLSNSTLDESGVVAGDSVVYSPAVSSGIVATFDNKNVGVAKVVRVDGLHLSGADAGNYVAVAETTADITRATLTVTGVNANKVYDGTTHATLNTAAATLVGLVTGDDVTLDTSGVTASFATKNVGNDLAVTYSGLALAGADAGNYDLVDPVVTGDVSKATLGVVGITADDKPYDGTTTAVINTSGALLTGAVAGDDVTLNTSAAVGNFDTPDVGIGKTVTITGLTLDGSDAGNYVLGLVTTTADVTLV